MSCLGEDEDLRVRAQPASVVARERAQGAGRAGARDRGRCSRGGRDGHSAGGGGGQGSGAIVEERFWILTHSKTKKMVEKRMRGILDDTNPRVRRAARIVTGASAARRARELRESLEEPRARRHLEVGEVEARRRRCSRTGRSAFPPGRPLARRPQGRRPAGDRRARDHARGEATRASPSSSSVWSSTGSPS